MDGLGVLRQIILVRCKRISSVSGITILTYPEHISIFQMRLRIPLLGMNEMGEFCRIPEEKHWGVVEHPIKVPFFGPKLDGETLKTDFRSIVS